MQDPDKIESNVFFIGVKDIDIEALQVVNSGLSRFVEFENLKIPNALIKSLSIRTEKKFGISVGSRVIPPLNPKDFIEIVDYDPVRNSALAIGKEEPNEELPLHWFIYRTFPHINCIIVLDLELDEELEDKVGITGIKKEIKAFMPDVIIDFLPLMKDNTSLSLHEKGMVFFNITFDELMNDMIKFGKKLESYVASRETEGEGGDK